jgi:hypothetical protein
MGQLIDPIGCRPLRLFDHLFFCKEDYSLSLSRFWGGFRG